MACGWLWCVCSTNTLFTPTHISTNFERVKSKSTAAQTCPNDLHTELRPPTSPPWPRVRCVYCLHHWGWQWHQMAMKKGVEGSSIARWAHPIAMLQIFLPFATDSYAAIGMNVPQRSKGAWFFFELKTIVKHNMKATIYLQRSTTRAKAGSRMVCAQNFELREQLQEPAMLMHSQNASVIYCKMCGNDRKWGFVMFCDVLWCFVMLCIFVIPFFLWAIAA